MGTVEVNKKTIAANVGVVRVNVKPAGVRIKTGRAKVGTVLE